MLALPTPISVVPLQNGPRSTSNSTRRYGPVPSPSLLVCAACPQSPSTSWSCNAAVLTIAVP